MPFERASINEVNSAISSGSLSLISSWDVSANGQGFSCTMSASCTLAFFHSHVVFTLERAWLPAYSVNIEVVSVFNPSHSTDHLAIGGYSMPIIFVFDASKVSIRSALHAFWAIWHELRELDFVDLFRLSRRCAGCGVKGQAGGNGCGEGEEC